MYWIALGMRSAFLPDEAAALEVVAAATTETVVVLGIWAVAVSGDAEGAAAMARRQTGSQVEAARDATFSACADGGSIADEL